LSLWERTLRFRHMRNQKEAERRVKILTFWQEHGAKATADAFSVSRRTLYRWQAVLRHEHGRINALDPKSTAPEKKRSRRYPKGFTDRVITLRREHPRLGKEKLTPLLRNEGFRASVSFTGRALGDLKKRGLLPAPAPLSFQGKTGNLHERVVRRRKKLRRPKGYRVLEADTVVRFIDGTKRYILTGIDTEKRTAFAAAYTNHGSRSATDFFRKTRIVLPDCPADVQTDNGSEFALHFHAAVQEAGLHFNTYPRSPKMNAHVERFNRTLDEEFLQGNRALLRDDVKAFNNKLVDWLLWYNGERPHHALGQVSPFRAMMRSLSREECQRWWTYTIY
ncbi:MAG: integrase core domain-containing protein, partial [Patescibacteria group bacterium]